MVGQQIVRIGLDSSLGSMLLISFELRARILRRENVKVGYKSINTLRQLFPKPKDKQKTDKQEA